MKTEARKAYEREYRKTWEKGATRQAYLAANKKRRTEYVLRWKKINRESKRQSDNAVSRKAYARLDDSQIRRYLKRPQWRGKFNNPTPEQIEQCRQRIQLKRAAKMFKLLHAAQVLSSLSQT